MANRQKYTRAALGHMLKHYERSRDEKGELVKYKNQDINPELTHLNYNLAKEDQPLPQLDFVEEKMKSYRCLNRKNVNVLIDWVVTLPAEMNEKSDDEKRKFFEKTYEFLKERYGVENVVSAYVHMDETQPHMHFAFIPVMFDRKRNCLKFNAKEVGSRKDLLTFHDDIDKYLEKEMGYRTGVRNGVTELNMSIEELKKLQKKMNQVDKKLDEIPKIEPKKTITGHYKNAEIDAILAENQLLKQKQVLQNESIKQYQQTTEVMKNQLKHNRHVKIKKLEKAVDELQKVVENDKYYIQYLENENTDLNQKIDSLTKSISKIINQISTDIRNKVIDIFEDNGFGLKNQIIKNKKEFESRQVDYNKLAKALAKEKKKNRNKTFERE